MQLVKRFPSAIKRSPTISGLTLALSGVALWYMLEQLAGSLQAGSLRPGLDGVYVLLLLTQTGYFVSVIPLVRQAGSECVAELRSLLTSSDAHCRDLVALFEETKYPVSRWTALAGALLTFVMQEYQFERFSSWIANPGPNLGEFWLVFCVWTTWTLAIASSSMLIQHVTAIHRLGRDCIAVDLMRIDQLAVFSHYGLRLAGFVVTLIAIWAVSLVIATSVTGLSWGDNTTMVGFLMVGIYVSLAIGAFVLPQLGIRRRIRAEKTRVCHQLTTMLPQGNHTLDEASNNPERLTALLSCRYQIQTLPEWPAGQHTHIQLVAYLLVPPASCSAAALVEEAISRLIS